MATKPYRVSEAQLAQIAKRPGYGVHVPDAGPVPYKGFSAVEEAAHKARVVRAAGGEIEAIFELQLIEAGLHKAPYLFQWPALKGRKFRLDVANPVDPTASYMAGGIALEVQGHVHRIKHQFLRDMERHNLLTEAGWTLYYLSGDMIRDGRALELARKLYKPI